MLQSAGHNHIRFTFVGEGVSKADLMRQAEGLGNVEWQPAVPKSQVPQVLAQADALLLLWRDSPFYADGISPNKLFDYFAAARPIVHAINSPFDPVRDAGAGPTIPLEHSQALADALVQLSRTSAAERQAMGARGRAYVEQHHDMALLGGKLGNTLSTLL